MRKLFLILLFITTNAFGDNSKKIVVSLDNQSSPVVLAVAAQGYFYFIDRVTCICTAGAGASLTSVPCKKLAQHKKLKEYVKNCK
jgi:hypothetical protein